MSEKIASDADYILGHAAEEEKRLQKGGQLMYSATKHLFQQAGIRPGMKVLDVGSGTGDVALLIAELVGSAGAIVGVDIYAPGLEIARSRLRSIGFENATFIAGDIRDVALDTTFDAVVGRNVLMYVADVATVLRACVSHLRPGGVIAFQDIEWSITGKVFESDYVTPLARQMRTWVAEVFRRGGTEMQIGTKLPGAFLDAGLPFPQMQIDGFASSASDRVRHEFNVRGLRDMLPKLREYGILTDEIDCEAFVSQMEEEVIQQRSFVPLYFMVGAWACKP
jgi:2-polyprenyl-3-methyl-5-hydroxy-6-metoxy-1,4-benzoquinol methylase